MRVASSAQPVASFVVVPAVPEAAPKPPPNPLLGSLGPVIRDGGERVRARLEDNEVAAKVAEAVRTNAKPRIDSVATHAVIPTIQAIGRNVDRAVSATETRVQALSQSADRSYAEAMSAVRQLRHLARDVDQWAQKAPEDPSVRGDATPQDVATGALAGKVYLAMANELERIAQSPNSRKLLGNLGETALQIAADGLEIQATLLHAGKRTVGSLLTFAGRCAQAIFGGEALRQSALHFSGSIKMNAISHAFNAGPGFSIFLPSIEAAEKAGSYYDAMVMSYGASAATPVMSAGWDRRSKVGANINLIFLAASFNEKSESVFVGVPGFFGVIIGKDVERGSYVCLAQGVPFLGTPALGAFAGWSVAAFSPAFDGLNKWITRPVARAIGTTANAVSAGAGWVVNHAKELFGYGEKGAPAPAGAVPLFEKDTPSIAAEPHAATGAQAPAPSAAKTDALEAVQVPSAAAPSPADVEAIPEAESKAAEEPVPEPAAVVDGLSLAGAPEASAESTAAPSGGRRPGDSVNDMPPLVEPLSLCSTTDSDKEKPVSSTTDPQGDARPPT